MPKATKLKNALASQQHYAAAAAAKKRARAAEEAKQQSVRASLDGSKKGRKRAKQAASSSSSSLGTQSTSIPGGVKGKTKVQPPTIPFDSLDTILLLGEANFSFAHSLILPPHSFSGHQIFATAFDSEEVTYKKYPDAEDHVNKLREAGVKVEFGVDAGALEKCKSLGKGRKWSRVVFNFPHVGAGITDQDRNILTNQHMLLRMFRSVQPYLIDGPTHIPIPSASKSKAKSGVKASTIALAKKKAQAKAKRSAFDGSDAEDGVSDLEEEEEDDGFIRDETDPSLSIPLPVTKGTLTPPQRAGSILITLLNCPPYTLWSVSRLATHPPPLCPGTQLPQPKYSLLRSFEFRPEVYEGYAHRRTIGFKEGLSKGDNEEILGRKGKARTWEFVRAEEKEEEEGENYETGKRDSGWAGRTKA
ncbi:hypothetical protein CI109_100012 [Kwoniella shandongensis]|uniref:Uncharacterized protein n=1 Tax=Kwoniella shandongensis TaxID=1734106 RepID=A0A5M6BSD6_9TREE|nr:uncharacterized protein CI109_006015 [Kwoniella shandongensis]KAA5525707.1 hypothetical protein CI109_006015 [Kwoniella shandongensis]